mmetsp:Transcript_12862/g.15583  ORF Transcript_12862/g.15583 Transcript_12862/m.15583 type:complete len:292 (+) Transcript_12862:179-1054(+)|eukprot:CAMPEP_0184030438 /NCGR_PEP_ID=MMETSP0955-20130417/1443_1 /TAXON_ID=627963 /ORGANISM="Aplanochytrium sp, Strain PBS07" /LENGTH=291 /DNA_ID=CAMNT_0026315819 /DNA_START=79 /DNA_END=954 /DNA_ORIENTATION=-
MVSNNNAPEAVTAHKLESDLDKLLLAVPRGGKRRRAEVTLVGAGPGDPELLTIAAYRVLQEADLVIADVLVSDDIIALCRGKVVRSKKSKGSAHSAQDELNEWMVEGARKGLSVCRLKGGDPFLFGRATEEIQFVLKHNISVKVIPGISSSMCSSLCAGVPITSRGVANQICIATGHGRDNSFPNLPEYKEKCSYVFLMAMSRLEILSKKLMGMGFPSSMAATIIEKATTKHQQIIKGNLESIYVESSKRGVKSPATIILGPVISNIEWHQNPEIEYESGGISYFTRFLDE